MKKVFRDYIELARSEDINKDIGYSILLGICIVLFALLSGVTIVELLKGFNDSINIIIMAFSILAGFNTTSLSIFATSDSGIVKRLREEIIEDKSRFKIDQILAYFSWSVVLQLFLLFFSIVVSLLFCYVEIPDVVYTNQCFSLTMWILVTTFIVVILYSIKLTIRNILILYDFLIAQANN